MFRRTLCLVALLAIGPAAQAVPLEISYETVIDARRLGGSSAERFAVSITDVRPGRSLNTPDRYRGYEATFTTTLGDSSVTDVGTLDALDNFGDRDEIRARFSTYRLDRQPKLIGDYAVGSIYLTLNALSPHLFEAAPGTRVFGSSTAVSDFTEADFGRTYLSVSLWDGTYRGIGANSSDGSSRYLGGFGSASEDFAIRGTSDLQAQYWGPLDPPPVASVPEPSSLALLALGALGLGAARRRAMTLAPS